MGTLFLLLIWSIFIIAWTYRKKNVGVLVFLTLMVVPTIEIGSQRINATYYWLFFYLFLIALMNVKIKIKKSIVVYCLVCILLILNYCIAWAWNGMISSSMFSVCVIYIRYIVLAIELGVIFRTEKIENICFEFKSALNITMFINFITVIFQMIIPTQTLTLIQYFFYDEQGLSQIEAVQNGVMSRYLGIYNHPGLLGIFCLFIIAVYLPQLMKAKKSYIYIGMALFCGISSLSKVFILGVPIIIILWIILSYREMKTQTFLSVFGVCSLFIIIFIEYENIYNWLYQKSQLLAYYFSFLSQPLKAFATRYDSQGGVLSETFAVIKEHFIIGVGPVPIRGETLADSAPILILHNGGSIALALVIILYLYVFIRNWRSGLQEGVLLCCVIILTGFALPTWIFYMSSFPILLFLLLNASSVKRINTKRKINVPY